jgi:hypothetical protein
MCFSIKYVMLISQQGVPFDAEDAMFQPPQSGHLSNFDVPSLNYREPSPTVLDSTLPTPVGLPFLDDDNLSSWLLRTPIRSGNLPRGIELFLQTRTCVDFSRSARSDKEMPLFYPTRFCVQDRKI